MKKAISTALSKKLLFYALRFGRSTIMDLCAIKYTTTTKKTYKIHIY